VPVNVIESSELNEEPLAGAVMVTFGAVFPGSDTTLTVMAAEPERPPLSVADAVIVCVPCERVEVENVLPVPMPPSRFERHVRLLEMLPSSLSMAVPVNVIESPTLNEAPLAGAVISDLGGVFSGGEELELTNFAASALVEHPPAAVDRIDTLA